MFVLRSDRSLIVAALRATPKENGFLLRSVQVARTEYGKGLGSQLVRETLAMIHPAPCWCYPFSHLQHFYEVCGFQLCAPEDVNDELRETL